MSDTDPCNHDWVFVSDWYGDPSIPNGTADCSYYRCKRCDMQQTEEPDEYTDPADQEQYDATD